MIVSRRNLDCCFYCTSIGNCIWLKAYPNDIQVTLIFVPAFLLGRSDFDGG